MEAPTHETEKKKGKINEQGEEAATNKQPQAEKSMSSKNFYFHSSFLKSLSLVKFVCAFKIFLYVGKNSAEQTRDAGKAILPTEKGQNQSRKPRKNQNNIPDTSHVNGNKIFSYKANYHAQLIGTVKVFSLMSTNTPICLWNRHSRFACIGHTVGNPSTVLASKKKL